MIGIVLFVVSLTLLTYLIKTNKYSYNQYEHIIGIVLLVISIDYLLSPYIVSLGLSQLITVIMLLSINVFICVFVYIVLLDLFE